MPFSFGPVYDALHSVKVLDGCNEMALYNLAQHTSLHEVGPGETAKIEQEKTKFLIDGFAYAGNVVEFLSRGDIFGRISGLKYPEYYSLKALTSVTYVAIPTGAFQSIVRKQPEIAIHITDAIYHRLHKALQRLTYQHEDIITRVRYAILALTDEYGVKTETGRTLPFKLTGQEFATYCAASRENVNRALNTLWDQRVIDISSGYITLL